MQTRRFLLPVLPVLLAVAFFADIATGSVPIPLSQVLRILLGGAPEHASWESIVLNLRLPQALTASLSGASLAVSGLMMQTLFRNPLAGPFVLGISSGASLGVAIVVLVAGSGGVLAGVLGSLEHVAAGVGGAFLVLGLVLYAARRVPTLTLLILGVLFGYATSALVSILLRFGSAESVQSYVIWTLGDFSGVSWGELLVLGPVLGFGLLMAAAALKPLDALLLGEAYARSLGVPVDRTRVWIISTTALLAGAVTAFCGPIGFLGIAVPHLCRSLFRSSDHALLLPAVAMLGAGLALLADLLAQVPGSSLVLPLNAITALLGAPVVIWVILSQRHLKEAFAR